MPADTSKYQFELEGYTSGGKAVKVHNTIDATILYFGGLINRDPELAQQLESTRPELQGALEYTKDGWLHSGRFHFAWKSSESEQQQTSRDAVSLSFINPEAAIAKAKELPGDQRAGPMLDLARNIAGDYPQRAAELIAEIQGGNNSADEEMSVNLISAQAFVAAAQNNKEDLQKPVQRGFESAYRATLEQQRTGDIHFFNGLGPLVQIASQNDLDLTITFIQGLPPSYLKAELLLGVAADLSKPVRVPVRFRPLQRAEKTDVTPYLINAVQSLGRCNTIW